jgi:hypothetical protein
MLPSITWFNTTVIPPHCLITDVALRRLVRIVAAVHPQFVPAVESIDKFRAALQFVSLCGRLAEPDKRFFPSFWGEEAERYSRSIFGPKGVDAWTFCAVVAAGDVPFMLQSAGWAARIGLSLYGGRSFDEVEVNDGRGGVVIEKCQRAFMGILAGTRSLLKPCDPPTLPSDKTPTQVRVLGSNSFNTLREPWNSA